MEARPAHPLAFLRYAQATPSSLFGEYDYPEATRDVDWGPDEVIPPTDARVDPPPEWLTLWSTPAGFWERYPDYDGTITLIGIGWPMPAFVVRTLPTEDRLDDARFGSYRFIDRVPPPERMPRKLPAHIYWKGLAANTVALLPLAATIFLASVGGKRAVSVRRRRRRVKRGLCGWCKYPQTGIGTCPECGKATDAGLDFFPRRREADA